MLEHQSEVGDGFPVRTGPGRVPGGGRPVMDDGIQVTGLRGVMDEPGHIGSVMLDQGGQDALVERHQPGRRHRARDGPPGQLVPEGDLPGGHGQQPTFLGRGQRGDRRRGGYQRVQQPALHRRRQHGQLLEHVLGGGVQTVHPGQHRVGDGRRDRLTLHRGQQLAARRTGSRR